MTNSETTTENPVLASVLATLAAAGVSLSLDQDVLNSNIPADDNSRAPIETSEFWTGKGHDEETAGMIGRVFDFMPNDDSDVQINGPFAAMLSALVSMPDEESTHATNRIVQAANVAHRFESFLERYRKVLDVTKPSHMQFMRNLAVASSVVADAVRDSGNVLAFLMFDEAAKQSILGSVGVASGAYVHDGDDGGWIATPETKARIVADQERIDAEKAANDAG